MFDTKIINWGNSPKGVELKNNEIHFWIASLEVNKKRINYLKKILSTDEIKKIDRINIKDVNHRHIASRALLRLLLGNYYIKDKKPNDITFNYNRFGKPSLENGKHKLNFNLSHSGDFIIYAFIQGYNIGIDIERIRYIKKASEIVARSSTQEVVRRFISLDGNSKKTFFTKWWTLLEAYYKFKGESISLRKSPFKPMLSDKNELEIKYLPGKPYTFDSFTPKQGYLCSFYTEGRRLEYRFWEIPEN